MPQRKRKGTSPHDLEEILASQEKFDFLLVLINIKEKGVKEKSVRLFSYNIYE